MKIKSFSIKNYRSIKKLEIDNPGAVNVFFGKNNVGKSNILRALHLAFYSLKDQDIFLPDTMFYNRNIYRPIEVTVDLVLEKQTQETPKLVDALEEGLKRIGAVIPRGEERYIDIRGKVSDFVELCSRFASPGHLRLTTRLDYNEETADIRVLIKDRQSNYTFDYMEFKDTHNTFNTFLKKTIADLLVERIELLNEELSRSGLRTGHFARLLSIAEKGIFDFEDLIGGTKELKKIASGLLSHSQKEEFLQKLDQFRVELEEFRALERPFQKAFEFIKEYFEKLSTNFILIPNKEYFEKGPLIEGKETRKHIKIFDIDVFQDRLVSLIESPSKKERGLIQQFNRIFGDSYPDLGDLEIRKFRDKVFAIFETGVSALPIDNQGLGVQDLYLYLAHMILFDFAIIAIEEPEGGLSAENQRILNGIIRDIYSKGDKQILISSHSEEFESPSSYVIEMGSNGTKEISRVEKEKQYEKEIDKILIKRKLENEKKHCQALLEELSERQMTLDVLNYIEKLDDKEKLDAEKISGKLGYRKEKIEEIIKEIKRRKG